MMKNTRRHFYRGHGGMTLMEILLVVSLIGIVSLAIYHALSNGIKVYQRHQRLVVEEDVVIFFEKLKQDVRQSFRYAKIPFKGDSYTFSFPTFVTTRADARSGLNPDRYIDQLGRVEYSYDLNDDTIYRRQANYSQALSNQYGEKQALVTSVRDLKFRYFYFTDKTEEYSPEVLETVPYGVEVEITFSDARGTRSLKKFIHLPIES